MIRRLVLMSACVLVCATAASAQSRPTPPPAKTTSPRGNPPPNGRGSVTPEQRQQIQKLREDLKKDQAEAQRLQKAIQVDKQAGDKAAAKRDADALAQVRKDIKKDQDELKRLQSQNGRGGV